MAKNIRNIITDVRAELNSLDIEFYFGDDLDSFKPPQQDKYQLLMTLPTIAEDGTYTTYKHKCFLRKIKKNSDSDLVEVRLGLLQDKQHEIRKAIDNHSTAFLGTTETFQAMSSENFDELIFDLSIQINDCYD